MIRLTCILATTVLFCSSFARAETERDTAEPFSSVEQIHVFLDKCIGENVSWPLAALGGARVLIEHPIDGSKMAWSQLTNPGAGDLPEKTISFDVLDQITRQVRAQFTAASGCYQLSGAFFQYQTLGMDANHALHKIFLAIAPNATLEGGYVAASEAAQNLYQQCTPDMANNSSDGEHERFVQNRVRAINGKSTILNSYVYRDVDNAVLAALLIKNNPQNCAQIEAINNQLINGYIKLDAKLRSLIAKAGYTFSE